MDYSTAPDLLYMCLYSTMDYSAAPDTIHVMLQLKITHKEYFLGPKPIIGTNHFLSQCVYFAVQDQSQYVVSQYVVSQNLATG